MRINTCLAIVISPIVGSVLFGSGLLAIVLIPELAAQMRLHLFEWAVVSLWATLMISLALAPRLRSPGYHRGEQEP